jgi:hypothetical protein
MNAFLWVTAVLCFLGVLGRIVTVWRSGQAEAAAMADIAVNSGMTVWALCLLYR